MPIHIFDGSAFESAVFGSSPIASIHSSDTRNPMQSFRCMARILFPIVILISGGLIFLPGGANLAAQGNCPNPNFTAQMEMATYGRPRPVVAADFDGNGRPDLAIGNSISPLNGVFINNVTIHLNNGVGGFNAGPGSPISLGGSPISIATADFNNDAKADLAIATESDNSKTITI